MSTPTYWTAFDFVQREVQHPSNFVHLAKCFFLRSGNTLPLATGFRGSFKLQSKLGRNILDFVVRPQAHRIWFLSCCVTKSDLRTFFGPGHVRFLFPQAINVAVIGNPAEAVVSQIPAKGSIDLSVFQCAPLLRQASVQILDGVHPLDLQPPWGQLTRIDLGQTSIHVQKFVYIMKQSLPLEDGVFYINSLRIYAGRPMTLRKISIPRLRQLRIRLVQPSGNTRIFRKIFRKLEMPSLNKLWMEREELGQIRDTRIYEPLLANLSTTLKRLIISEHSVPQSGCYIPRPDRSSRLLYQDMEDTLHRSQNLTSLSLCPGMFVNPLVLDKLASGEFLPFLEKLEVSSIKGWDIILMVGRKNFTSTFPECGSSFGSAPRRPVALKYLGILVIGYGLDKSENKNLTMRPRRSVWFADMPFNTWISLNRSHRLSIGK